MAEFTINDMSGALFKNKDKKTDRHPDYTGQCVVNGELLRLSAWIKTSKAGNTYMSLAFSVPDDYHKTNNLPGSAQQYDDDDIPF